MHFSVSTNGNYINVKFTFRNGLAGDAEYTFAHHCGNQFHAGLAAEALNTQLRNAIEEVRRLECNAGYKDGRGKKRIRDWFYRSLKLEVL